MQHQAHSQLGLWLLEVGYRERRLLLQDPSLPQQGQWTGLILAWVKMASLLQLGRGQQRLWRQQQVLHWWVGWH